MKVTVADCLALDAFKGSDVAAGKMYVSNEVKAISVLDACNSKDLELYKGDKAEILLTGFLNVRKDVEEQCRIVEGVAGKGCAALVVYHVGKVVKSLDKKVAETAERAMLPLIVMPADAEYSTAITEVMDKVLYGDNFRNSLISNTVFHLLNFEKHSNFQSAVREAAINNDFQLIILSEDFNPILTVETRHKATIADAIKLGKERNVESNSKVYTMIDVNGVLTYWGPVTINNDKYYMFIVDNEDSYTAGEITKLAEIIELAMGMWKYTPERDAKAEFIKALIRGNKSLAYTLKDEAKISGDDILSVFFSKGIGPEMESQVFSEFEKEEDLNVMKITEGDETYGMILTYEDEEPGSRDLKNSCVQLFNKLKGNKKARIFHVTGLNGIEGAGDAYRLISESWSFVQSVFPYKRVFTKYELTLVSNCINIQIQGGFVKKNYIELLEPFKEAGENKGKQLLETLETFVLDAGMNSGKTAEFMGIHTNTVQYRLKKINEMLGVEITGNRVIPGLTMALALKRLERVVS
ncbi:MAG: PucR family transcriptional regulator ligand-binding domain-containing protein [Bacillota bacterium]|nr:PucR family transcriptional regulator ligand-binding domain-containing protein [Bacillota bacterium]